MKVVADNLARIALEKRFLIDELELTGYFNIYSHDLVELRSMCNTLIDGKRTGGRLKSLIIDNPVSLSENTPGFKDCLTLETVSLTLYENNTNILARHFSGCKSLKCIELRESKNINWFYTIDGVLYNHDKSKLIKYPANKGTEFTIPKEVGEICDLAFEDSQLTTLTITNPIPAKCTDDAFEGVNPVTLTIKVPKGSYDSYWVHPVFGKFNLEEMDE